MSRHLAFWIKGVMVVGALLFSTAAAVQRAGASPVEVNFGTGGLLNGYLVIDESCCVLNYSISMSLNGLTEGFGLDPYLSYPDDGILNFFGSGGDYLTIFLNVPPDGHFVGLLQCYLDECGQQLFFFGGTYSSVPTPEPSSLLLLGTGLLGLSPLLRRKLSPSTNRIL